MFCRPAAHRLRTLGLSVIAACSFGVASPLSASTIAFADGSTTPVTADRVGDLEVEMEADGPVDANGDGVLGQGDTIQYRFTVSNVSAISLNDIGVEAAALGTITCGAVSLDVEDSTTCAADNPYAITEADANAGTVEITARAIGTDPDNTVVASPDASIAVDLREVGALDSGQGNTADQDSTATGEQAGNAVAQLDFRKLADPPVDVNGDLLFNEGDIIQYRFVVFNTGSVEITDLNIIDEKAGAVVCDSTVIVPKASVNCVARDPYIINAADTAVGVVTNTAHAVGVDPGGATVKSPDSTTETPLPNGLFPDPTPGLRIEQVVGAPVDANGDGAIGVGDTVSFGFLVSNTGNLPIMAIEVENPAVGVVNCDYESLSVGESMSCAAESPYALTQENIDAGVLVNVASVVGTTPFNADVTSEDSYTATRLNSGFDPGDGSSLGFEKIADDPVEATGNDVIGAGDTIVYRFTVINNGATDLYDVVVHDSLTGPVTCGATDLRVGEETTCLADSPYPIGVNDMKFGAVINRAWATAKNAAGDLVSSPEGSAITELGQGLDSDAAVLVINALADAPVDVNEDGVVGAGDQIQYRYVITNGGSKKVTQLEVVDDIAGSITCETDDVFPADWTNCIADALYTVTADDVAVGTVTNVAYVKGISASGDPVESETSETVTVLGTIGALNQNARLDLVPVAHDTNDVDGNGTLGVGDTITYRFTVSNTGDTMVSDVGITASSIGSISCDVTELGPGATTSCVAAEQYTITEADVEVGSLIRTATAGGRDGSGVLVESETVSMTTDLESDPDETTDNGQTDGTDSNNSSSTGSGDNTEETGEFNTDESSSTDESSTKDESSTADSKSTAELASNSDTTTSTTSSTQSTSRTLANTGAGIQGALAIASLLVGAGLSLTILSRRRRYAAERLA